MSAPKPRFWTTQVKADKSATEICDILRKHGARKYAIEFDSLGHPVAVSFSVVMEGLDVETLIPIRLVAQTDAILKRLANTRTWDKRARAHNIAWRQLKAWVEISLELHANRVKPMHEVFLGDVMLDHGQRMAEVFESQAVVLLSSGD